MNSRSLSHSNLSVRAGLLALGFALTLGALQLRAQGDLQAQVAELKESAAKNKEALAQYSWQETVKIILKGEEKKTEHFEVRQGPDGKPIKTPLDPAPAAQQGNSGGRLKQRVVAKKKEEYKEYADSMKELTSHYVPPDKDAIQDAFAKGNISIIPGGPIPGEVKLVIHNYYKPGDTVTLRFDKNQKQLQAISVASWMDDPKDAMNLTVAFAKLPDGTSHVSSVTVEGVAKQLTVNTTNSDYQHL
ncbi:MAG: hypothetical protein WB607_18105 [Candidatus Acidiferrum sp.]|jgi:hypothetical protein